MRNRLKQFLRKINHISFGSRISRVWSLGADAERLRARHKGADQLRGLLQAQQREGEQQLVLPALQETAQAGLGQAERLPLLAS